MNGKTSRSWLNPPALRSSEDLPALLICSRSLAWLRYRKIVPSCCGRPKVKSRPPLFHVLNCSVTDTSPVDHDVRPGNWRKLWESVNVTATETGSAQEKVTLPWEQEEGRERERNDYERDKTWIFINCRGWLGLTGCHRGLIGTSLKKDTCISILISAEQLKRWRLSLETWNIRVRKALHTLPFCAT